MSFSPRFARLLFSIPGILLLCVSSPAIAEGYATGDAFGLRLLWSDRHAPGLDDAAAAIALDPAGDKLFVTGTSTLSPSATRYDTVAYDTDDGSALWSTRFGEGFALGVDVAIAPNGETVYVTGRTAGDEGAFDTSFGTIAYATSDGSTRWVMRYDGPFTFAPDVATALDVAPDGSGVYVTGWSSDEGIQGTEWATLAYAPDDGAQLWLTRIGGSPTSGSPDRPTTIVAGPGGDQVYVGGRLFLFGRASMTSAALGTPSGEVAWISRDGGRGPATALAIAVPPDGGRVFVAGAFADQNFETDLAIAAYDSEEGSQKWVARRDGEASGNDSARAVVASPDGTTVFVAGDSDGIGTGSDILTVAYDAATGAELWATRTAASGLDEAAAIGITPDGSVLFVAGTTDDGHGSRIITIGLDPATGETLGNAVIGSPGARAAGLVVDGVRPRLFVTGSSDGGYLTAAYGLVSEIRIDIAPGRDPNVVDVSVDGTIQVAIFGAAEFDVRTLDPTSVRFGPGQAPPLATWITPAPDPDGVERRLPDLDGDGYDDIIVPFSVTESGIGCADTEATLSAGILGGGSVSGSDAVVPTGCN